MARKKRKKQTWRYPKPRQKFARRREELIWSIDLAENDPVSHYPYDIYIELVNEAAVPLAYTWKSYGSLIVRKPPRDGENPGEYVGKLMFNPVPDGEDYFTIPELSHIQYYSIYSAVEALKLRSECQHELDEKIFKKLINNRRKLYEGR